MGHEIVTEANLPLPRFSRGKVRDTYDLGDRLLMVTSDRISAFDCVMPNGIPDKGRVLTRLSRFWFDQTADLMPNHLISTELADLPEAVRDQAAMLDGRFMIVRKAQRLDFECVARGYLAGSGWADYQRTGAVCGVSLPPGLRQAQELPEPIFTPAAKNESGHDENVPFDTMTHALGGNLATAMRDATLRIYRHAASFARDKGIIVADTKLEFGLLDGQLILIDELITPDSSRFWALADYTVGSSPPSFDKQYLRDWLEQSGWDKQPPAPTLPDEIVNGTAERYREALRWLTGEEVG